MKKIKHFESVFKKTVKIHLEMPPLNRQVSTSSVWRYVTLSIMAASLKVAKQIRSWNNEDSFEKSDVVRLFDPENVKYTKPASCTRYWMVYLSLISFVALFIIGILLGFFVRADPKVQDKCQLHSQRADGFSNEKLQAVHNNLMYFISAQNIADHKRYCIQLYTFL